ncbi:MAG: Fe-S cluster assembly protein SufD [Nitrospinae bacterium]|nr:Fe-S cluster assembly protein SufD [Nitrospinota bacterium]
MAPGEPIVKDSPFFAALDRFAQKTEFRAVNEAALARIMELGGLPGRKHEMFTFANVRPHIDLPFQPKFGVEGLSPAAVRKLVYHGCEKSFLVIADGVYYPGLSDISAVREELTARPLADAMADAGARLRDAAAAENDITAAMNGAFCSSGLAIGVKAGAKLSAPLQIIVYSTSAKERLNATFPAVTLDLGEGAKAVVIVKSAGDAGAYLCNALFDLQLGIAATLDWAYIQSDDTAAVHLAKTRLAAKKYGRFNGVIASKGGKMMRHHSECRLQGEGAELSLSGVAILEKKEEAHHYVRVHHEAPRCQSRQHFKNILHDAGHSSVDTCVTVHPGAQLTDSNQLVNNLMLSPDAVADNKPWLSIYADDVKCTHGATVGKIDEDQIFYLKSRGIAEARARALLTTSFAQSVIGAIPQEDAALDARDMLIGKLEAKGFGVN